MLMDALADAKTNFKFHYVSINSIIDKGADVTYPSFKFHYVSINSEMKNNANARLLTLNSIMFLLILIVQFLFQKHLRLL